MIAPQVRKLAHVLVHYSTEVKAGETVRIMGTPSSEPLLREVYREVLRVGAHPVVRMRLTDEDYLFYGEAMDSELDYVDALLLHDTETVDVSIGAFPDQNPHLLTSVDPAKKQRRLRARGPITRKFVERWEAGQLRWVGTAYPTQALAQELPSGLAAVALNPGIINTDMLRSCFGGSASGYPSPEEWAKTAVPFLLKLGPEDNGKPLTAPNA